MCVIEDKQEKNANNKSAELKMIRISIEEKVKRDTKQLKWNTRILDESTITIDVGSAD